MYEVLRLIRRDIGRRIPLTQVQWRALALLSRNQGINQAGLAELLEVRPMTLARLVDRLEAAGWVERRRDPNDRRAVRLYLTGQAGPLIKQMEACMAQTRKLMLAGLPEAEQARLVDTLSAMKNNLIAAELAQQNNPLPEDPHDD